MIYDPDVADVLALMASQGRKPYSEQTVTEARENYRISCKATALPSAQMATVRDLMAQTPEGSVKLRFYRPLGIETPDTPAIVFFHGGGWVIGDLDTHDPICRNLAQAARCCVIAVDYRLAPEHIFPAAAEDAIAAYRWIVQNSVALGVDPLRLAVAGDSAGGALAAVVALAMREGDYAPRLQILFYPVTDLAAESPSYARITEGVPLVASSMRWFRDQYVPDPLSRTDWRASPLRSENLRLLPPTFIVTAANDPLCDEGIAYANRLETEGVRVSHLHLADQIHGILTLGGLIAAASNILDLAAVTAIRIFDEVSDRSGRAP